MLEALILGEILTATVTNTPEQGQLVNVRFRQWVAYNDHGQLPGHAVRLRPPPADAGGLSRSGGKAIVPGQASESGIIQRILAEDPAERMPPERSGKKVTASQFKAETDVSAEGKAGDGAWHNW